jgi:methylated-DNA-[protein]-cysteine S-methyltransferase
MITWYDAIETPMGWTGALASVQGLRRTTLPQATPDECLALLGPEVSSSEHTPGQFTRVRDDLLRLFDGEPVAFDWHDIDVGDAPPFHRAAWLACRSIPVGETRSYSWLAAMAGRASGARAAGQSMARNRLPLVIPCHRVIASDGGMGGYGSGSSQLGLKRWLLDVEAGRTPSALQQVLALSR